MNGMNHRPINFLSIYRFRPLSYTYIYYNIVARKDERNTK